MIRIINSSLYHHERINIFSDPKITSTVHDIIEDVKKRGDEALRYYAKKFDDVDIEEFELDQDDAAEAFEKISKEYIEVLQRAAFNVLEFHRRQLREGFMFSPSDGIILGQRVFPLERVGIYVPGGAANYPSTLIMNAVPAKVAGCKEIIIATPNPSPEIVAAASVSGVGRVLRIGGAQAIAALAYGTESVPKVDKITGPGNIYVNEAKRQVYGHVDIDMIAGPSEVVIVADKNNFPAHIAADMLAQAEHDPNATAILITNSKRMAFNVSSEIEVQITKLSRKKIARKAIDNNSAIEVQITKLSRKKIARKAIDNNSAIVITRNLTEAAKLVDEIAPEHLEICVDNPFDYMTRIKNAGSVFIGRHSPEALGDYYAGINHTLPTLGTARFASPLSVDDFMRKSQFAYYSETKLKKAADDIQTIAMSEGLDAHARSISIRGE